MTYMTTITHCHSLQTNRTTITRPSKTWQPTAPDSNNIRMKFSMQLFSYDNIIDDVSRVVTEGLVPRNVIEDVDTFRWARPKRPPVFGHVRILRKRWRPPDCCVSKPSIISAKSKNHNINIFLVSSFDT